MIGALFALALQAAAPSQAAAAPPPAAAPQDAGDAIGDILAQPPPDEPAAPTPAAPPAPAAAFPSAPTSDGRAQRYESGVRASFQAREARQGDLDGRWTVSGADGQALFLFQLADPGPGRGPVEGAWRALGPQGGASASGFIDAADRAGRSLTVAFQDAGPCTVTLTQGPDGRWTGQIRTGDKTVAVVMARP